MKVADATQWTIFTIANKVWRSNLDDAIVQLYLQCIQCGCPMVHSGNMALLAELVGK